MLELVLHEASCLPWVFSGLQSSVMQWGAGVMALPPYSPLFCPPTPIPPSLPLSLPLSLLPYFYFNKICTLYDIWKMMFKCCIPTFYEFVPDSIPSIINKNVFLISYILVHFSVSSKEAEWTEHCVTSIIIVDIKLIRGINTHFSPNSTIFSHLKNNLSKWGTERDPFNLIMEK